MATTTGQHQRLTQAAIDALREVDDATFWREVAAYGYRRPERIDPDQAWFWKRTWITGELEADLEIAEGRTTIHYSDEEFLAALEQFDRDADV